MRVSNSWGPMARVICLIIALGLILAAPAFAEKVINGIKVTRMPDRTEVTVTSNQTPYYSLRVPTDGSYVCFAFSGRLTVPGRYVTVGSGRIWGVRYCNYSSNPPVTRVVFSTGSSLNYSTRWSEDKHSVTLTVWKYGVKPQAAKATAAPPKAAAKAEENADASVSKTPVAKVPAPNRFVSRAVEQKGSDSGAVEPVDTASQETSPPVVNEPVDGAGVGPAPTEVAKAVPMSTHTRVRNISLDFIAADINDVLKALSVQSGTNIVCGADVKGAVTVSLNKVSLEEALDYVAKLSGYRYARDGDTYIVGSASGIGSVIGAPVDTANSELVSEAVTVRFCDPKGLEDVLKKQFPDLRFSSNDSGDEANKDKAKGLKYIAFVGPKDLVAQARQMVEKLESAFEREADGQTVDVYEVRYADPKQLVETVKQVVPQVYATLAATDGFKLKAPGPVSVDGNQGATIQEAKPVALNPDDLVYQRIILAGQPNDVKKALDLLARTDVRLPQVLIEAKVTSISLTAERLLGVKWGWSKESILESTKTDPLPETPSTKDMSGSGKFFRMPVNFNATLDAMFSDGTAKLLANPHISTVEGKPAVFFVGDEIKYVINITTSLTGTTVSTDTAKVGIQLRVAADVSPDREITLNLHPEVSVITDYIRVNGGGGTSTEASGIVLPQIARRFTDQVIRVKDGESIVIGGLIKENETENLTKVPLLGDLPFFGAFFKHREKTREKTEIVVFLKASIVE